jgi:hypothetical protein
MMENQEKQPAQADEGADAMQAEVDVLEHAESGKEVPHAKVYRVRIDGVEVKVDTRHPTGEMLLGKVGKRSCAYELIEEFVHHKNNVVEPNEVIDLGKQGLKGFITAHKEIVTIFIDGAPVQIERGNRSVAEVLARVGKTPDEYALQEEKGGHYVLLPGDAPVKIHGCEVFRSHVLFDIQIDRTHYKVAEDHLTGEQLRNLPKPPIGPDFDLFEVVPGGADRKIGLEEVVEIGNGLRFFTAPSQINPGKRTMI